MAVTGYIVERDGAALATTASLSWMDRMVAPATTYQYTIRARDAAGNISEPSLPASVTTQPAAPRRGSGSRLYRSSS